MDWWGVPNETEQAENLLKSDLSLGAKSENVISNNHRVRRHRAPLEYLCASRVKLRQQMTVAKRVRRLVLLLLSGSMGREASARSITLSRSRESAFATNARALGAKLWSTHFKRTSDSSTVAELRYYKLIAKFASQHGIMDAYWQGGTD